jgi:hypothetical protein
MESGAGYFLAAEKIPKIGSPMRKKDEVLGRFSRARHPVLLDPGIG